MPEGSVAIEVQVGGYLVNNAVDILGMDEA
jgi:hypothetical protein